MAGLWDQIGGFLDQVGDVAGKVQEIGEQVSTSFASLAGLKTGTAVGTPPLLPSSLPPGYAPLFPTPTGNQPNVSSMGSAAIKQRIAEKQRTRDLTALGVGALALWLLARA